MKDLFLAALTIISFVLLGALCRGVVYESILKSINKTGEMTIYNEVYTCQLKGSWKEERLFIPTKVD